MVNGRIVLVERTLFSGEVTREWMPAFEAAVEAIAGPQNGVTVARLVVRWGEILDEWTRSA